jgi:hypothetical protein
MKDKKKHIYGKPVSGKMGKSKKHKHPELKKHNHPELKKHKQQKPPIPSETRESVPKIIKMSKHQDGKQEKGEIQLSKAPSQIQKTTNLNQPVLDKEKLPKLVDNPSQAEKDSVADKTFKCKKIPETDANLRTDTPIAFLDQDTPVVENSIKNETVESISISTSSPFTLVSNGIVIKADSLKISSKELPSDEVLHLLKKWLNNCLSQLCLTENSKSDESTSDTESTNN